MDKIIDGRITGEKTLESSLISIIPVIETAITCDNNLEGFLASADSSISVAISKVDTYVDTTGLEYESGRLVLTSDSWHPTIRFARKHDEAPVIAVIADADGDVNTTAQTMWSGVYFDFYKLFGAPISINSSDPKYGSWYYTYKGNYSSGLYSSALLFDYGYDNPLATNYRYARYYCTESEFTPYSYSTTRYFRRNRTYKWYAIWRCKDG